MATVSPTTTPFTLDDATRWYQGDITDNPEFSGYWNLYGDPPDSKDWWIKNNQLTPESTNWFTNARAGGNQTAAQQAASDKDNLLGEFGGLARIGAMIPGPWQPFAAALSAADSASTGDWLGALGAGYGAYSGFTSPSFKNPISGLGDIFGSSTTSSITEANAPNNFGGWSADSTADWASQGGGVDPGTTVFPGSGGGNMLEDLWKYLQTPKGILDGARGVTGLLGTINGISQGRDLEKTATGLANADKMDRSFYRDELEKSYTDPWGSADANASRRGLRQIAERAGARGGVNPIHTELALQSKLADILDQRRRTLSGLAGAQFDPANSSSLQLTGLQGGFNRTNAGIDQLTSAIGSILQGAQNPKEDFWKWLLSTRG